MKQYQIWKKTAKIFCWVLLFVFFSFKANLVAENRDNWKAVLSNVDKILYRPSAHGLKAVTFTIFNHGYIEVDPSFSDFRIKIAWQAPDKFEIELVHLPPNFAHLESALKEEHLEFAKNIIGRSFLDEAQDRTVTLSADGPYTKIEMMSEDKNQRVIRETLWVDDQFQLKKIGTTLRNGQMMITTVTLRQVGSQYLIAETFEPNFNIKGVYSYRQIQGIWMMTNFKMHTQGKTIAIDIENIKING